MTNGNMFTLSYPLLIEHILREAKLYRSHIVTLERGMNIDDNIKETELFWDQIMMEHAQFIRGLLDPVENALIGTANNFANDYADLLKQAQAATDMTMSGVTQSTLQETIKYRDFKEAGTKGIAECKIRSIILPCLQTMFCANQIITYVFCVNTVSFIRAWSQHDLQLRNPAM